jgi:(1->4)-alpha-D-glucan 1-alpha-D-glucosylmutase
MNASSTHDTKRSEDVRARIEVISELTEAWEAALTRWWAVAEGHVQDIDGMRVPAANEEHLIFQTLVGAWPLAESDEGAFVPRLRTFLRKAAREAKTYSSWSDPNERYENGLISFTERLLQDSEFLNDFRAFHEQIAWFGALNSLSQLTLKLGVPGVADIYQGNETWTFNLVDPDNRRPVDFGALHALAAPPVETTPANVAALMHDWRDGRIKLHVTRTGLHLRKGSSPLFLHGDFIPIHARGRFADNVIAFARRHENQWALIVVGRYYSHVGPRPIAGAWADTMIDLPANAPSGWRNVFTNEITDGAALEAVFATLPIGVLIADGPG